MNQLLTSLDTSQLKLSLKISKPAFLDFFNREVKLKLDKEDTFSYKDISLKILSLILVELTWQSDRWQFGFRISFIPKIKEKALVDKQGIDLTMNGAFKFYPKSKKKIIFHIEDYNWSKPPSIKIFGFKFSQEKLVNFVIDQAKDRITEQVNTSINKNAEKYFSAKFLRPLMAAHFKLEADDYFANIDGKSLYISEFSEENDKLAWQVLANGNAYLDSNKDDDRFWNSWSGLDWYTENVTKPNHIKLAGAVKLNTLQKLLNNSLNPIDIPALGALVFDIKSLKAKGRNIELILNASKAFTGEFEVNAYLEITKNKDLIVKLKDIKPMSTGSIKKLAWDFIEPVLIKRIESNLQFTKTEILKLINLQIKNWDSTLRKQIKMKNEIVLLDYDINQLEAEDQQLLFDLDITHKINLEITSFY